MKSKVEIIHKNGQPYGIRNKGGYLLFFPKVTKDQEERYIQELDDLFYLANTIKKHLENYTNQ